MGIAFPPKKRNFGGGKFRFLGGTLSWLGILPLRVFLTGVRRDSGRDLLHTYLARTLLAVAVGGGTATAKSRASSLRDW